MSAFLSALCTAILATAFCCWLLHRQKRKHSIESIDLNEKLKRLIQSAQDEQSRLLDSFEDSIFLVNENHLVCFANHAAASLFESRELLNRPIQEVFLEPRLSTPMQECLKTGEATRALVILPQQSSPLGTRESRGINAWIVDCAWIPPTESHPPMVRVLLKDTTETHQAEQIRKDFVANASHELRTPLAIINGYLEHLLDEDHPEDPATAKRFLTIMRKHAGRITRIVDDMLAISKLESGSPMALSLESFSFESCVRDVLEQLESMIRMQQAEIEVHMPGGDITLEGDRFYWTQILFNLVENALKHNPSPGLHIAIGGIRDNSGCARIWVSDNGIGIPSADMPHIFRRFFRVEKHHSQREIQGTGLGLSITKRAIEAHGGTIQVTSTPGRETRFQIDLKADCGLKEPDPAG